MLLLLLVSSKIGLWMGATPERLLKAENKVFYYGIAGTQKKSWFRWGDLAEKEMEEQFVTDFI
jgi:isochorismate synthase